MLRCLEWKHLTIKLVLVQALLTTVQICCDIVNLLSVRISIVHLITLVWMNGRKCYHPDSWDCLCDSVHNRSVAATSQLLT